MVMVRCSIVAVVGTRLVVLMGGRGVIGCG